MTTVPFDTYFPFPEPGRQATMPRWRAMGRLWLHDGVVQGVGEQFPVHAGGWNPAEGRILIGTGAAWVNGFYGETANWTWVQTPGNDGMVKVRLDPGAQQVLICYEAWHGWHEDPWAAHGIVETPLWEVWPDGRWADRRHMVSPDVVEGLETIPDWVPWGSPPDQQWWGPAGAVDVGVGGDALSVFLDWMLDFVPGRTYQVTGFARATQGPGWSNAWAHLRALTPEGALVKESRLVFPITGSPAQGSALGWGELVLPATANLRLAVQVVGGSGTVHFEPSSCYIEVADLGRE